MDQQSIPEPDGPLKGYLNDHSDPLSAAVFMQDSMTPVADALHHLRDLLITPPPQGSGDYGQRLRFAIGHLWNMMPDHDANEGRAFPDGQTGADRARLIASLQDAARHIYAWCDRNGCTGTSDIPDDDAARQGWPDAVGKGWSPPWDILGIQQPDWWGKS